MTMEQPKTAAMSTMLLVGMVSATSLWWLVRRQQGNKMKNVPHLPSWIPYLGSAMQLNKVLLRDFILKNAEKLNHKGVFSAMIAGKECLFIVAPEYMNVVFKEIPELDTRSAHKQFTKSVMRISDPRELNIMFADTSVSDAGLIPFNRNLLPTEPLRKLNETTQTIIRECVPQLLSEYMGDQQDDISGTILPMYRFVCRAIFRASTGPLLSKHLMSDKYLDAFLLVEGAIPLFMSEIPDMFLKDAIDAHTVLVDRMMEKEFHDEDKASQIVIDRLNSLTHLNSEMLAKNNVGLMVAALTNSVASIFWTLWHILNDDVALSAVRTEVNDVLGDIPQEDLWSLEQLEKCTLLDSCFQEILRLYQSVLIVRDVVKDLTLNPKDDPKDHIIVSKGTRIMGLPNTMHMDPNLFPSPEKFIFDRFIKEEGKPAIKPATWKPFGGGAHLCPGRKFATVEAKAFVAYMLLNYKMELVSGSGAPVPDIDTTKQGVALARPRDDLPVKIMERKSRRLSAKN